VTSESRALAWLESCNQNNAIVSQAGFILEPQSQMHDIKLDLPRPAGPQAPAANHYYNHNNRPMVDVVQWLGDHSTQRFRTYCDNFLRAATEYHSQVSSEESEAAVRQRLEVLNQAHIEKQAAHASEKPNAPAKGARAVEVRIYDAEEGSAADNFAVDGMSIDSLTVTVRHISTVDLFRAVDIPGKLAALKQPANPRVEKPRLNINVAYETVSGDDDMAPLEVFRKLAAVNLHSFGKSGRSISATAHPLVASGAVIQQLASYSNTEYGYRSRHEVPIPLVVTEAGQVLDKDNKFVLAENAQLLKKPASRIVTQKDHTTGHVIGVIFKDGSAAVVTSEREGSIRKSQVIDNPVPNKPITDIAVTRNAAFVVSEGGVYRYDLTGPKAPIAATNDTPASWRGEKITEGIAGTTISKLCCRSVLLEDNNVADEELLFLISDQGLLFSGVLSNETDRYFSTKRHHRKSPAISTQLIKARLGHNGYLKDVFSQVDMPAVAAIDVGVDHVMAVTVDGDVYAWGKNKAGRLGIGHARDCFVPTVAATHGKIIDVKIGSTHSVALDSRGRVYTTGSAKNGRLGTLNKDGDRHSFAEVVSDGYIRHLKLGRMATQIGAGENDTMILFSGADKLASDSLDSEDDSIIATSGFDHALTNLRAFVMSVKMSRAARTSILEYTESLAVAHGTEVDEAQNSFEYDLLDPQLSDEEDDAGELIDPQLLSDEEEDEAEAEGKKPMKSLRPQARASKRKQIDEPDEDEDDDGDSDEEVLEVDTEAEDRAARAQGRDKRAKARGSRKRESSHFLLVSDDDDEESAPPSKRKRNTDQEDAGPPVKQKRPSRQDRMEARAFHDRSNDSPIKTR